MVSVGYARRDYRTNHQTQIALRQIDACRIEVSSLVKCRYDDPACQSRRDLLIVSLLLAAMLFEGNSLPRRTMPAYPSCRYCPQLRPEYSVLAIFLSGYVPISVMADLVVRLNGERYFDNTLSQLGRYSFEEKLGSIGGCHVRGDRDDQSVVSFLSFIFISISCFITKFFIFLETSIIFKTNLTLDDN